MMPPPTCRIRPSRARRDRSQAGAGFVVERQTVDRERRVERRRQRAGIAGDRRVGLKTTLVAEPGTALAFCVPERLLDQLLFRLESKRAHDESMPPAQYSVGAAAPVMLSVTAVAVAFFE